MKPKKETGQPEMPLILKPRFVEGLETLAAGLLSVPQANWAEPFPVIFRLDCNTAVINQFAMDYHLVEKIAL